MLVAFSIPLRRVKCVCVTRCFFLSIYLKDHKPAVDKREAQSLVQTERRNDCRTNRTEKSHHFMIS